MMSSTMSRAQRQVCTQQETDEEKRVFQLKFSFADVAAVWINVFDVVIRPDGVVY